jgi:hypothetical protein
MKLTTKARSRLPSSAFAGPGRSYPVEDRSHAANAKARAVQQNRKGNLPSGTMEAIIRRANTVLSKRK